VTVLEAQPRPAEDDAAPAPPEVTEPEAPPPAAAPAADAGELPPAEGGDDVGGPPGGGGPVLAACLEDGGGCTVINISVLDEAAGSCVELVVDDCGTFSRAGIPVDTPVTWRLGSASVADLEEACVPAAFDPDSAIIVDGSGSISWNLETRRPSDLVLDVSLEAATGAAIDSPIGVTGTFAGDIPDCES
jgi:hypothetical protein